MKDITVFDPHRRYLVTYKELEDALKLKGKLVAIYEKVRGEIEITVNEGKPRDKN